MSRQPVLVVEHEAQCPPGWVGDWLLDAGCVLDVRRPYRGDPIPGDLNQHRSLVVLGGSMDAYAEADHPWLADVSDLIRGAVADRTPVLGVCLGLQLVTVALGGSVHRNPRGQQIGVLPVGWLSAAWDDALCSTLTEQRAAVQWNDDVVRELPDGAVVLAQTPHREVQAASFGSQVWGVQWHPELGEEIVSLWAENDRDAMWERGIDVAEYVAEVAAARESLQGWRALATSFAALSRGTQRTAAAAQ